MGYANLEKYRAYQRGYQRKYMRNKYRNDLKYQERTKQRVKRRTKEAKLIVFNHYSKSKLRCECCKEPRMAFLTLDHINNNGAEERKTMGNGGRFYLSLIKKNLPEGYRVLCFNCNCGRRVNGGNCPHEEEIL